MEQNNAKVVLVTGASRGIGMAIAERLAHDAAWVNAQVLRVNGGII